ncbi:MAG: methylglyoxal synthase [Oscillospiraceae bacterium]|nr:methylglyoxal synthase [Oscillospiraceae bacterium]
MNIALTSHNAKHELMIEFCIAYGSVLSRHTLFATDLTAKLVSDATGLKIIRLLPRELGGDQQIASRISCREVDMLLFFRDPNDKAERAQHEAQLLRLCDTQNIPVATNISTAEPIIHSLINGDLDYLTWRGNGAEN